MYERNTQMPATIGICISVRMPMVCMTRLYMMVHTLDMQIMHWQRGRTIQSGSRRSAHRAGVYSSIPGHWQATYMPVISSEVQMLCWRMVMLVK